MNKTWKYKIRSELVVSAQQTTQWAHWEWHRLLREPIRNTPNISGVSIMFSQIYHVPIEARDSSTWWTKFMEEYNNLLGQAYHKLTGDNNPLPHMDRINKCLSGRYGVDGLKTPEGELPSSHY